MAINRTPKGNRVIVKMSIPGANTAGVTGDGDSTSPDFYVRMKEGTAKYLDMVPVTEIPEGSGTGTNKGIKFGVKGTKSFVILLKTAQSIGGVSVKRLSIPVPSKLSLREFYKWAKVTLATKCKGFKTPDGRHYYFEADSTPAP